MTLAGLWTSTAAQVPGSALDNMLQRPPVAKHFKAKHFGDRLFVEGGLGATTIIDNSSSHLSTLGIEGGAAIGDWVTPIHGWRMGVKGGTWQYKGKKSKVAMLSLDYLMNLTALSKPTLLDPNYSEAPAFEVYGTAGADLAFSHYDDKTSTALGVHAGLRGQLRLSKYTYFYVEPRLGIYGDEMVNNYSWRNYRFGADVMAGFGYRLSPDYERKRQETDGHFLDNTFFAISAGPGALLNTDLGSWKDRPGVVAKVSLGKWFTPSIAARVSGSALTYKQGAGQRRIKGAQASAGILWNLHSTFGGYNPDRKFWLNLVGDVNLSATSAGNGKQFVPGFGGGAQVNFNIAKGVDLYIEPRVDIYKDDFTEPYTSIKKYDVTGNILAGFAFRQGNDTRSQVARNDDFKNITPYDNIFVETSVGGFMPVSTSSIYNPDEYARPAVEVGIGKWFTATDGIRLRAQAFQIDNGNDRYKAGGFGVDYLWNLTNAFHGYVPERKFALIASAGVEGYVRSEHSKPLFGVAAGLKGLWNVNKMWGLYIEPRAGIYQNDLVPYSQLSSIKADVTAQLMAGLQVYLGGYEPGENRALFEANGKRSFFTLMGGTAVAANSLRTKSSYGVVGSMGYGQWYSPLAAWRVSAEGFTHKFYNRRYARAGFAGDWIVDLSAMSFGFDTDRIVNLRGLAGLRMGMDYYSSKAHFASDIHGGAQLAFRLARNFEIFAEPQVAYRFGNRFNSKSERIMPSASIGVSYYTNSKDGDKESFTRPTSRFISLSIGTGAHTSTVQSMSPMRRKYTFDYDLSYGRWFTDVSGLRVGLSDATVQVHGKGNRHITALHGDYLFDFLALSKAYAVRDAGFRFTGLAGVNFNVGSRTGYRPTWAVGLEAGAQVGWAVNDNVELYLEPSATIMGRTIVRGSTRPAEGQVRLQLGTKFNF